MVKRAQETRSRTQDIANRAAQWVTYIALTAGGGTLVAWLALGQGFEFALERMVTVMVIACPHALGHPTRVAETSPRARPGEWSPCSGGIQVKSLNV
jgi:cation transport ATPase